MNKFGDNKIVTRCVECDACERHPISNEGRWLVCTEVKSEEPYKTDEGIKNDKLILSYEHEHEAEKQTIPDWCPRLNTQRLVVNHCILCPHHRSCQVLDDSKWLLCKKVTGEKVHKLKGSGELTSDRFILAFDDENDAIDKLIPDWCPFYKDGSAVLIE